MSETTYCIKCREETYDHHLLCPSCDEAELDRVQAKRDAEKAEKRKSELMDDISEIMQQKYYDDVHGRLANTVYSLWFSLTKGLKTVVGTQKIVPLPDDKDNVFLMCFEVGKGDWNIQPEDSCGEDGCSTASLCHSCTLDLVQRCMGDEIFCESQESVAKIPVDYLI